jgi:hypothetical protein
MALKLSMDRLDAGFRIRAKSIHLHSSSAAERMALRVGCPCHDCVKKSNVTAWEKPLLRRILIDNQIRIRSWRSNVDTDLTECEFWHNGQAPYTLRPDNPPWPIRVAIAADHYESGTLTTLG